MDKKIIFTAHSLDRIAIRGTSKEEVIDAIEFGSRESGKENKIICRLNLSYNSDWMGSFYPIKQVAPVIVEEGDEIIVITVYTYYF